MCLDRHIFLWPLWLCRMSVGIAGGPASIRTGTSRMKFQIAAATLAGPFLFQFDTVSSLRAMTKLHWAQKFKSLEARIYT
jgi:hypothetical protein